MKVHLDKIGSVTIHANLPREVELADAVQPRLGDILVVKALQDKTVYNTLELVSGRMARISRDDVIAGVLGRRRALRGFVGEIPETLKVGDRLHVLNLGGVLGVVVSGTPDVGKPLLCEVLGGVKAGDGVATIRRELPPAPETLPDVPLVLVEGTCMSAGKTHAAATIVGKLTQRGWRVHGAKLTGVACLKDTLNMEDHGAKRTMSFLDMGLPSTVNEPDMGAHARRILAELASDRPDAIVVELGDGIIGHYGVQDILKDREILARTKCHVMAANDLVAAWGAVKLMTSWGIDIDVLTGPATDNDAGEDWAAKELRIPAANARTNGHKLTDLVEECLG
ncbi:MAG: hypothetical protein HMLKMBBP_02950 [Planctomycetes bacterium]|nr:hypothetical protein [Planctomycetota bacterium]